MNLIELFVPGELVICKSCGYVMGRKNLREKCPACGVSAKMFEPYTEKISPYRKFILMLDIHPVLVHFPQAFTFTILVLSGLCLVISGDPRELLLATLKILSVCLPFTVIFSIGAGLFDGKIRFRKVSTPLLIRKIYISGLFLILSAGNMYLALFTPLSRHILTEIFFLSFCCFICSVLLGLIGVRLLNSKFPG